MATIESKVSETILQKKKIIKVGVHVFYVAPPTIATLIEVSELISELPEISLNDKNYIQEALSIAKNCKNLGKIAATAIVGVKKQSNTQLKIKRLLKWLKIGQKSEIEKMADFINENLSPKEYEKLIMDVFKTMELANFFVVTTSLLEINLLKATR